MMMTRFFRGLAFASLVSFSLGIQAQVTVNLNYMKKGPEIGNRMYGIFFEEINHAGDGGLYAELIHNRSFEDNADNPDCWWTYGDATQAISTSTPLNNVNPRSIRVTMNSADAGIRNEGWWGIKIVKGEKYKLNFWTRSGSEVYKGDIKAVLQNQAGNDLGSVTITNEQLSPNSQWKKVTAEIVATGNDGNGWFALLGTEPGTIYYDMVSLFPPTYKDRENGCRKDLAEMLEALHPKFLRFPGGCVVEGKGTVAVPNRFEWKKSRGPIEQRPGHFNANWFYPVTDGLGMMEYLQLAEDLGAEPMFVCNMGMGHDWEDSNVQPYIQEALDAIEYCNGDENTYWGQMRIKDGHPAPFNLRLLEIGNENYWFGPYSDRYRQFQKAISEAYPYIEFIGDGDGITWGLQWPVDFVDQHYYMSPQWFINEYHRYDGYARDTWKVYVGEYAVTSDCGGFGNLNAALGEAVFMCGMENNSDVVKMASYAPIFVNEESSGWHWHPDMIRFHSADCYGTPSYHIQQMMAENVGTRNIKWTEENNTIGNAAHFALSSWGTSVKYDNIVIKSLGETIYENDFSDESLSDWTDNGGTWRVRNGELCQVSTSMNGALFTLSALPLGSNYIIDLDATKVSGAEGFLIGFNVGDTQNYCWWNLGGWGNTLSRLEQSIGNYKNTLGDGVDKAIQTGKTYHLQVVVSGTNVKCYIDGQLVHNENFTALYNQKLFLAASTDEEKGLMYVKVVNPSSTPQQTTFHLANAEWTGGDVVYLTSSYGTDENTTENPRRIIPKTNSLADSFGQPASSFSYDVPAYSCCIFRLGYNETQGSEEADSNMPAPIISYGFSHWGYDDSGTYPYSIKGDALVSEMDDGNRVFFSGEKGYLDLTTKMARDICPLLTGDYSVSVDVLVNDEADLTRFCWAYGLTVGTSSYMGLVNAPGNNNWYYEIKRVDKMNTLRSETAIKVGEWNNIVFSQRDGIGTIYVNGYDMGSMNMDRQPSEFTRVTAANLAKSPFDNDDLMSSTYFDDFKIYNKPLSAGNAVYLYNLAKSKSMNVSVADGIDRVGNSVPQKSDTYTISGQKVDDSYKGLIIKDHKKILRR
jgi:alpha-L-arabinofuranosidase